MPNHKHVRFSPKVIDKENKETSRKVAPDKNAATVSDKAGGERQASPDAVAADTLWEKLVLYYLARLKGLCDWRSRSQPPAAAASSDKLEECVVKNVVEQALPPPARGCMKPRKEQSTADLGAYMAAGYEEGKQQAAKIVTRALKYGLMTGILRRQGSAYRVRAKYLGRTPTPQPVSHGARYTTARRRNPATLKRAAHKTRTPAAVKKDVESPAKRHKSQLESKHSSTSRSRLKLRSCKPARQLKRCRSQSPSKERSMSMESCSTSKSSSCHKHKRKRSSSSYSSADSGNGVMSSSSCDLCKFAKHE